MKELIPMNDYGIFADGKDTARANSLIVAKMFGKRHDHVLRAIKNLECSKEFRQLNFGESSYINEQNKKQFFLKGRLFKEPIFLLSFCKINLTSVIIVLKIRAVNIKIRISCIYLI